MKKITKILTIEKDEDWVVANTPDLDRDSDRIFPDKINVTNFRKNPALFWGHNYRDPWALIGEVAEWQVDERSFRFRPELREASGENDPMNIIRSLWDNGLLRAASIGFIPKEWEKNDDGGLDFEEVELLEISLVPLPAHQDALRMAIKAFSDDEQEENTTDQPDVEIRDIPPDPETTEQADPDPDDVEEPNTNEDTPHDESDDELDAIEDDLQQIADELLEVLQ